MCRAARESVIITLFGCGDHVDGFGRQNEKGRWEFVSEKPELRVFHVSHDAMGLSRDLMCSPDG